MRRQTPKALRRFAALVVSATLTAWAGGIGPASADTSPGPSVPTPSGDAPIHCPPEQYPHAGSPRSAAFVPYEIPFTATLGQKDPANLPIGGYLQIANGPVTATLGGPVRQDLLTGQPYGSIFASACGVVQLPSESGAIPGNPYGSGGDVNYNNNFAFSNPIAVSLSLTGFPGLPVLSADGADDGNLAASILKTPAANGGLDVTFAANAKSTSDFGPALNNILQSLSGGLPSLTLPPAITSLLKQATAPGGSSCTITIGNEIMDGTPQADVQGGKTGLSYADATAPVTFTTQKSGNLSGRPVTGPVTASNATLVANDFAVGAIDPATSPAPQDQGATCSASTASLLDQLLGLPSIPDPAHGKFPNSFYAPGTFSVYTSS